MDSAKAEQAIVNGIYAAIAWLILDLGLLFEQHGSQVLSVIASQPELGVGIVIVIACAVGLYYKSRLAAVTLFLLFLLPLLMRMAKGIFPGTMMLLFSLILLYLFLTAVLGTFSFHQLMGSKNEGSDNG